MVYGLYEKVTSAMLSTFPSVEPLVKTCYTLRRKLVSAGHQYGRNRHMQACVYAHLTQARYAKGVRKGMDHYYEKRNQYR